MASAKKLVTMGQAADELQVPERSVRRYLAQRLLIGVRASRMIDRAANRQFGLIESPGSRWWPAVGSAIGGSSRLTT